MFDESNGVECIAIKWDVFSKILIDVRESNQLDIFPVLLEMIWKFQIQAHFFRQKHEIASVSSKKMQITCVECENVVFFSKQTSFSLQYSAEFRVNAKRKRIYLTFIR